MPLTEKGAKILHKMKSTYGHKKGKEVFYASRNAGKITGVDRADDNQHMGFTGSAALAVEELVSEVDSLAARLDGFETWKHQKQPQKVEPRNKDNMQPSNRHAKDPRTI